MIGSMNRLRISGINSQMDTQGMVDAMSATTKLRITNNQRKVLKLQAQQLSYRNVISKLQNFQNTYFNVLNKNNFLKSASLFNQTKATVYNSANEVKTPTGVTVSSNPNATPGTYKVTLVDKATQTKVQGGDFGSSVKLDLSAINAGDTFAFTIKVNNKIEHIMGSVGATENATDVVNGILKEKFGTASDGKGIIRVDNTGKLEAKDKSAISVSNVVKADVNQKLNGFVADGTGMETGRSVLRVQIGNEFVEIPIDLMAKGRFDSLYDSSNTLLEDVWKAGNYDADKKAHFEGIAILDLAGKGVLTTDPNYAETLEHMTKNLMNTYDSEKLQFDLIVLDKAYEQWNAHLDTLSEADATKERDDLFEKYFIDMKAKQVEDRWTPEYEKAKAKAYSEARDLAFDSTGATKPPADWKWTDDGTPTGNEVTVANWNWVVSGNTIDDYKKYRDMKELDAWVDSDSAEWKKVYDDVKLTDYTKAKIAAYDAEKLTAYNAAVAAGETTDPIGDWKWIDGATGNEILSQNWTWEDTTVSPPVPMTMDKWATDTGFYVDVNALRLAATPGSALADRLDEVFADKFEPWLLDHDSYKAIGYQGQEAAAFKKIIYADPATWAAQYTTYPTPPPNYSYTQEEVVTHYNSNNLINTLDSGSFTDGTKLEAIINPDGSYSINAYKMVLEDDDLNPATPDVEVKKAVAFALSSTENLGNVLGVPSYKLDTASVDTGATLATLGGITFDAGGTAVINVNGKNITIRSNMSVNEMITAVNNSDAGVTMAFNSLNNSFSVTSKEYGTGSKVELSDSVGFFDRLGLGAATSTKTLGENMKLDINGEIIETTSSAYTIDGTTFSFSNNAAKGTEFTVEVEKNKGAASDAIKNFVKDYNALIEDVFGMIQEKPQKEYYFLTEDDIAESGLSDREVEKWEIAASKGLLYRDTSLSTVMTDMRNAMMAMVEGSTGKQFGLFNIRGNDTAPGKHDGVYALRPSGDYKKNGMLEFDEDAMLEALERNPEDIIKLFTGAGGIMEKLEKAIDRAVNTSIDPKKTGTLIMRAGTATGLSSIENTIFDEIKYINERTAILQTRYERQQDRYWKMFTEMEKQFAALNNQSSYLTNMFGNMGGNNQ